MTIDIFTQPAALAAPAATPPQRASSLKWWLIIAALLAAWHFRDRLPNVDPPLPIPTTTPAVLFATDGDQGLSVDQAQVVKSQTVRRWCADNGVDYRSYDLADDISPVEDRWRQMMDAAKAAPPPAMVTATADGKGSVSPIPNSADATIRKLETIR